VASAREKELALTEITESAKKDYYVNDHGILSPLLNGIFLWWLCGLCEKKELALTEIAEGAKINDHEIWLKISEEFLC